MVERGDVTGDRQDGVGQTLVVGWHRGEPFDLADHVVAEVADDPAMERGQGVEVRGPVGAEQGVERREGTLVERDTGGYDAAGDLDLAAPDDQGEGGIATEEREAAPPLPVLDRFEEEPGGTVGFGADELHERRDRGLEVGEHLAPHRDDGVPDGEGPELVARRAETVVAGHDGAGPKDRKKQLYSPVWQAPRPSCSTTSRSVSPSQS